MLFITCYVTACARACCMKPNRFISVRVLKICNREERRNKRKYVGKKKRRGIQVSIVWPGVFHKTGKFTPCPPKLSPGFSVLGTSVNCQGAVSRHLCFLEEERADERQMERILLHNEPMNDRAEISCSHRGERLHGCGLLVVQVKKRQPVCIRVQQQYVKVVRTMPRS